MGKQSEQTQGQQLLKQFKDKYRRPEAQEIPLTDGQEQNQASGSLPDPQYWPADISRAIN